ncbi:MAG TPA: FAD-linked oxidase C-terminal domain-containing protein, partial [Dehalococcoidia bacterium]|nr:FAD-linked oxidase C-terminal domain-containing protein [Dehalococcoidia bacterium]
IYKALRDLIDRYADQIRARFPKIPRSVSGYAIDELLPENGFNVARALTGSEGTCVTILEADLRLVHSPPSRVLVVLGYEDVFAAGDDVPEVLSFSPIGLEGMDGELVGYMQRKGLHPDDVALLPKGDGWLLAEFGGETPEEAKANAQRLMDRMKGRTNGPDVRLLEDPAQQARIWLVRESGLGATAFVPGLKDAWEGWEDSAVAPERLGDYLRSFRKLLDKYEYYCALYGHFGQGCVHVRIDFDLLSQPGIDHYRAFAEEAAENVVRFGGSLSGEHGDGQSRAELLPKMFGDELVHAFEEFKSIWDPAGMMNPGKLVHPYRLDENLRLGTDYNPPDLNTHFSFEPSEGSFARAALRCVGVGECRRLEGGTMCPSYRATREEKHSTRGRAHLLFEMLEADPLQGGWRSEEVKDALDLCLACKGCKGDCPVNVDMATYKAEFLSHYYERRLRPRAAYAFGLINVWARLLSNFAGVANLFTQTPLVDAAAKLAAGIDQRRKVPAFATKPFRRRFEDHGPAIAGQYGRVILWPDTFNNYFLPDAAEAATEVLERLGFDVALPPDGLCCGRPLYDFGMLDRAKRYIERIVGAMRPEIRAGTPIVVLEPSCLAVFRDELPNLLPHDEDANRLHSQTFLLAEFLADRAAGRLPHLEMKAIVHGHCHQKALAGMRSDEAVLKALGLDYEMLDDGCCGMAGSFGFEAGEHCDVSLQAGELGILPAVRNAPADTIVIADGFSCRQQVWQVLGRMPLHLAQVLQMAFRQTAGE